LDFAPIRQQAQGFAILSEQGSSHSVNPLLILQELRKIGSFCLFPTLNAADQNLPRPRHSLSEIPLRRIEG
jgi:hypothetical protein